MWLTSHVRPPSMRMPLFAPMPVPCRAQTGTQQHGDAARAVRVELVRRARVRKSVLIAIYATKGSNASGDDGGDEVARDAVDERLNASLTIGANYVFLLRV